MRTTTTPEGVIIVENAPSIASTNLPLPVVGLMGKFGYVECRTGEVQGSVMYLCMLNASATAYIWVQVVTSGG